MTNAFLSVTGLAKSFGAVPALRGVSLTFGGGEIRAICGENGAGKSTLVKLLMGIHAPDRGTIAIDGIPVEVSGPKHAQRLGLSLVAQELSLVPHLSILDNIWLGSEDVPFFHRRLELRRRATRALHALNMHFDLDRPVSQLTIGQRQIVEIARLLTREARILILDEPTATLSDVEIEHMFKVLRALRERGHSVIYITHRLGEVFEICDSVTVLRNGEHVCTSPVSELDRQELVRLMLGRSVTDMYPSATAGPAQPAAVVAESISIPSVIEPVSFVAPRGKILALAGQIGSGATELTRAVAGLAPGATGSLCVDGRPVRLGSPYRARLAGISFVSEDRATDGLFNRTVLENLTVSRMSDRTCYGILSWRRLREAAQTLAARVGIDRSRLFANAFDLSGGNQQKILFGRAADRSQPGILVMNEPTRGVDVGARAEIYDLMRGFCREGYALVMTSSDLEEVAGMADIVLTLYRGRVVGRYEGGAIEISTILADITHPDRAA